MAISTAIKFKQNQSETTKKHPLKNKSFFGIPRHVALIPGLTDRLFRLLSILCAAYGDDGHIEFKIRTLAALLQKGERQTKDLVKEAKQKGYITTKETGRSLVFFLEEICFEGGPKEVREPARQVCGFPHTSNHLEKKPEKDEELSNPPSLTGADLVCFLLTTRQRQSVPVKLVNSVGKHIPDKEIPKLIKDAFDKNDPCGYMWGAIKKKQKADIKARQSLTPPPSDQNLPPNPQEEPVFKYKSKEELYDKNKYLTEYINLPDQKKKIVYDKILHKTKIPILREQLIEKGYQGLHEVDGMDFRIKMALGYKVL